MLTTTRRLIVVATAAAALVPAAIAGGQDPAPTPPAASSAVELVDRKCPRGRHSVKGYRAYATAAYKREKISRLAHRKLRYMAKCQHSAWGRQQARKVHDRLIARRRDRQRQEACTPFGEWAIPGYIVMRESRGRNVPNQQGSDASGFYQILRSTWLNAGGPNLPGVRFLAMSFPKGVQDCVAHRLATRLGGIGVHWALTV